MPIQDEQWGYIRDERNGRLMSYVDPKSLEAFNNGTELSPEWKTYRQALLDLPSQDGDDVGDLVWPVTPE